MRHLVLASLAALAAVSACSTTPLVTKENAMLTPAQIAEMGLVCRSDTPPDSNIPRTICASEASWAAFDERRRRETDEIFAEGRKNPNVGRFNRD